jgi:Uma2 family endonuclease
MTAMALPADQIPNHVPFTVDDLEAMPEDGRRYELVDGTLIVSPAPNFAHQEVAGALYVALRQVCPKDLRVVIAPFEWRRSDDTSLQPDVLVARREDLFAVEDTKYLLKPPLLAVEVQSPSTRRYDRLTKLSVYQDGGVGSYWLIDPNPHDPSITVLDLKDDCYAEVARLTGDERLTVERPFQVELCPADLVAELQD